ncbi:MAG: hypothetical protein KFF74_00020 [Candidatus Nanosynbacter sp.]|jgi:hypothetical protein|nr:hypothetical protein [Candidatus Nanosynbacter sp.]
MDDNILKINGKSLSFKESDIKLFRKLKNSIDGLDRVLRESGKIPDWKRKEFIVNMTEGYLSVMLVLHDILSSTLDVKYHSVREAVHASYSAEQNLVDVFVAAGAAARTQPRMAWATMTQYNRLASCHTRLQKRLNGATISALKKTVRSLEEQRKGVKDLGNYLVEIAIFSLQVEENIHILIDDSDILQLEERQISQLHNLLGRVKTLLEWKHPQD